MGSKPKGLALVVNIPIFVNGIQDERKGSEHDINRLTSIFKQLDYEVEVHNSKLTASDIREIVVKFAKKNDHWKCDSSVVFMMSHGNDDKYSQTVNIIAYDGISVNSQWVVEQLSPRYCKALQGKPKLFFFQACRGSKYQYPIAFDEGPTHPEEKAEEELILLSSQEKEHNGLTVDVSAIQTDGQVKPVKTSRIDSDTIIGYSTSPGYVSMRDPERGSWYIQVLCQVIAKHAWKENITTILRKVDKAIERKNDQGALQTPTWWDESKKTFHFNPGLFDNTSSS